MSYSTIPVMFYVFVEDKHAGLVIRRTDGTWAATTIQAVPIGGKPAKSKQAAISRVVRYAERQARNV